MKKYSSIPTTTDAKGNVYYKNVTYPIPPSTFQDIYVYTTIGDRFDMMAQQYYGDSTLWWAISSANPNLKQDSYYIPEGTQIRIPANVGNIISNFEALNG